MIGNIDAEEKRAARRALKNADAAALANLDPHLTGEWPVFKNLRKLYTTFNVYFQAIYNKTEIHFKIINNLNFLWLFIKMA